jgi:hypothetical protein
MTTMKEIVTVVVADADFMARAPGPGLSIIGCLLIRCNECANGVSQRRSYFRHAFDDVGCTRNQETGKCPTMLH